MLDYGHEIEKSGSASPFIGFTDFSDPNNSRHEYASVGDSGSGGIIATMNDRFAHRNPVAALNVPRDPAGIMTMSMKYAEDNYIVAKGIKIKKNFAAKDMSLIGSSSTVKHYQSEFRRLKMRYWVNQIFRYYFMLGRVVMYWGDDRPLKALSMLDPRLVNVKRFMGIPYVFVKPDRRWKEMMTNGSQEGKFLKRVIPAYWKPYIMREEEIPLKDGTYALIENDLSLFASRGLSAIGGVPLQPAFNALQILNLHLAGDFSVAWMMKNLIALVSIGNPALEKERYVRADQVELQKLQAAFQKPEYAMWAYVDPTVDIRFFHPDPTLYATDKYKKPTEIVEYVMGLPPVFSPSGSSSDYNSSTLTLKPFREEIEMARGDIMDQFFSQILPVMRDGYTRRVAGTKDAEVIFDQDSLKEDRVILEELTAKYDRGALSMQSLLEGKAQTLETEMARKKTELDKYEEVARPIWDMNHGNLEDKGGRPETTGQASGEKLSGSQTPRPSRA
jgi:hypothetical protein